MVAQHTIKSIARLTLNHWNIAVITAFVLGIAGGHVLLSIWPVTGSMGRFGVYLLSFALGCIFNAWFSARLLRQTLWSLLLLGQLVAAVAFVCIALSTI